MTVPIFVDTNVLVYAIDASAGARHVSPARVRAMYRQRGCAPCIASAGARHVSAQEWMESLWKREAGRLSIQVLQEFYVTVTRKLRPGMSQRDAQIEVRALLPWGPIEINSAILERAWFVEMRYGLSWWDALIVGSAQTLGCRTLLTEDLQHGQDFDGLVVCSPLRSAPSELGL